MGSLSAEQFEELCFQLARIEFPGVERLAPPDFGLDFVLRDEGRVGRGWQAKRYTEQISWPACRDSLDRAREQHEARRVTFCFARDLTGPQQKLFEKHLRSRHSDVAVDYWGRSELTARLSGSDEGERVARYFFGAPASDAREIAKAIRAGGELASTENALDRASAVGEYFQAHDPYFSYQIGQRETGGPRATSPPGTVVSFERVGERSTERIDALPRSSDALDLYGPAGTLRFSRDPRGEAALRSFRRFLAEGGELDLEEGVTFSLDRLPPALADLVELGEPMVGRMRLIARHTPWRPRFHVISTEGDATIDLDLEPLEPAPARWDAGLSGTFGGLVLTLLLRATERGGELNLTWRYTMDNSPARNQRNALRFLKALQGDGQLLVEDRQEIRSPLSIPLDRQFRHGAEEVEGFLRFLEDLVTLEERTGVTLTIPDQVTAEEIRALAHAAYWIREGEIPITWDNFTMTIPPESLPLLASGSEVQIEEKAFLTLFGRELFLGTRELTFHGVRIVGTEATADSPSAPVRARVEPGSEEAGRIMMRLRPPAEGTFTP